MKRKGTKRSKLRRSNPPPTRTDSAKSQWKNAIQSSAPALQPWLRILSRDDELGPTADSPAGLFTLANGRRQASGEEFHRARVHAPPRGSRKNTHAPNSKTGM